MQLSPGKRCSPNGSLGIRPMSCEAGDGSPERCSLAPLWGKAPPAPVLLPFPPHHRESHIWPHGMVRMASPLENLSRKATRRRHASPAWDRPSLDSARPVFKNQASQISRAAIHTTHSGRALGSNSSQYHLSPILCSTKVFANDALFRIRGWGEWSWLICIQPSPTFWPGPKELFT